MPCPLCNTATFSDRVIREFDHAYWVLSENQYYYGYSLLIVKNHYREWHDIPENMALSLHENIRYISQQLQKLHPHKINLASFGNIVEHVHWHLVPRYLSDPQHKMAPDLSLPSSINAKIVSDLRSMLK